MFERCEGVLIWGLGDRRSRGPILSFCASFLSTFHLDSFIPSCVALGVWARIFQGELDSAGGGVEYLSRLFVAAILSGSRVSFPIFRRYGRLDFLPDGVGQAKSQAYRPYSPPTPRELGRHPANPGAAHRPLPTTAR